MNPFYENVFEYLILVMPISVNKIKNNLLEKIFFML